jgi:hypothetical protein
MEQSPRYWFAAKRYGYGWGLPLTWQGWLVYAGWFAVLFGGLATPGLRRSPVPHLIFVLAHRSPFSRVYTSWRSFGAGVSRDAS